MKQKTIPIEKKLKDKPFKTSWDCNLALTYFLQNTANNFEHRARHFRTQFIIIFFFQFLPITQTVLTYLITWKQRIKWLEYLRLVCVKSFRSHNVFVWLWHLYLAGLEVDF